MGQPGISDSEDSSEEELSVGSPEPIGAIRQVSEEQTGQDSQQEENLQPRIQEFFRRGQ